jgi:hypothetical protein
MKGPGDSASFPKLGVSRLADPKLMRGSTFHASRPHTRPSGPTGPKRNSDERLCAQRALSNLDSALVFRLHDPWPDESPLSFFRGEPPESDSPHVSPPPWVSACLHDARGEGWVVNHKKVQWLGGRKGCGCGGAGNATGTSTAPDPVTTDVPNRAWAVDFQFDVTTDGRPIKIVSIIDEHTRECLGAGW